MIKPEYGEVNRARKRRSEIRVNAESVLPVGREVKKPISVSARVFPLGTENKENATTVKGKVTFTFIYLAEDGYKKAESSTDVVADLALIGADARFVVEDVRAVYGGENYTARCSVKIIGESVDLESNGVLFGGENLLVKETTETVDKYLTPAKDAFTLTDEFELDYAISDVLSYDAALSLAKAEAGVGKISAEGEMIFTVNAVAPDGNVVRERRTVAYRFDLESPSATPDMRACAKTEVGKLNVRVFTDEDKNKSTVSVEAAIIFSGTAVAEESVTFAEDAFSETDQTTMERSSFKTEIFVGQSEANERVSGETAAEIPDGGKIIGIFGEKAVVIAEDKNRDGATVNGLISLDVLVKNSDNGVSVVAAELPYSIDIAGEGNELSYVFVSEAKASSRDGKIYLDCTLKAGYKTFIDKKINYVSKIESIGERIVSSSPISVYLPQKGDGLWEVAKDLGISGEEVVRSNPDLVFPLTGRERIIIYRQKI